MWRRNMYPVSSEVFTYLSYPDPTDRDIVYLVRAGTTTQRPIAYIGRRGRGRVVATPLAQ
jgi:hypothetical protein